MRRSARHEPVRSDPFPPKASTPAVARDVRVSRRSPAATRDACSTICRRSVRQCYSMTDRKAEWADAIDGVNLRQTFPRGEHPTVEQKERAQRLMGAFGSPNPAAEALGLATNTLMRLALGLQVHRGTLTQFDARIAAAEAAAEPVWRARFEAELAKESK